MPSWAACYIFPTPMTSCALLTPSYVFLFCICAEDKGKSLRGQITDYITIHPFLLPSLQYPSKQLSRCPFEPPTTKKQKPKTKICASTQPSPPTRPTTPTIHPTNPPPKPSPHHPTSPTTPNKTRTHIPTTTALTTNRPSPHHHHQQHHHHHHHHHKP